MIMRRGAFLETIHRPALLLILRNVLVPPTVTSMPGRDGAFLLHARFTDGSQALDLELQFCAIVVRLGDGLEIFFILVPPLVNFLAVTVARVSQGAGCSLEDKKLLLELGQQPGDIEAIENMS